MTYVKEIAIIGIVAIEIYALHQGVNGTFLAVAVGAIAGIAGFIIGKKKED